MMARWRTGSARMTLCIALMVALAFLQVITPVVASAAPGPPSAPQWWFDSWNVPALWSSGANGTGITIAEIDTGVSSATPELASKLVEGHDFGTDGGDGWVDHSNADASGFAHGTAMASIMVASPGVFGIQGLAQNAKLMPIALPINGTDDSGGGGSDHLPDAIRWAVDHGGKIISMSLGGQRDPRTDAQPCPQDEQAAITYAISKGAIVTAASGNAAAQGSPVEDPGVCIGVVSVGSVDQSLAVSDFSSRHPYLTLTAPGDRIPALGRVAGSSYVASGTSQANAVAAAALALVWSKFPTETGQQILSRVLSALDHSTGTQDPGYGWGIINPAKAIANGNPAFPNPVYNAAAPYVAQYNAAADPKELNPPAASSTQPGFGAVRIGSEPSPFSVGWVASAGVALAGVLLALALLLWRRVSIRREREQDRARATVFGYTVTGDQHANAASAPAVGAILAGAMQASTMQASTVQAGAVQAGAVQAGAVQAGATQASTRQAGPNQAAPVRQQALARRQLPAVAWPEPVNGASHAVAEVPEQAWLDVSKPPAS